ncbi:hypothetical protein [Ktedonobacter racemifer]|uniref:Uncharacterized protein n=1 Tax=Ktedonobacter racemifer DSM 44963 TaxID=485913 RepID=D6TLH3_KTERA|nr:hypothetical protein [Ktedonobacter racemifer]EFH86623.1 hypothetical protein Krac_7928 [Ktedonobacter racemifer DSM 44963]
MVHRHPMLYRILGLVFLGITLVLIFIGVALDWSSSTRTAVFILSFFPLLLALVYFHLGTQEERGF